MAFAKGVSARLWQVLLQGCERLQSYSSIKVAQVYIFPILTLRKVAVRGCGKVAIFIRVLELNNVTNNMDMEIETLSLMKIAMLYCNPAQAGKVAQPRGDCARL